MPIGEFVMPDYWGALVVPAVLVVSGVYVACDCWWRRRQRARGRRSKDVHPAIRPPRPRTRLVACVEREYAALREAENVVHAANAKLSHLYLEPAEAADGRAVEDAARAPSLFRP
jgi:hypothetical protein